ncbi:MAG: type II toxin-antitoxin system VapC family toxin [Planctomycetaceae bacterium]
MTLTDTGALVAILDRDDGNHAVCRDAATKLPAGPMVTTWPCFVEAMYLLGAVRGFDYQSKLWKLHSEGRLLLHDLSAAEVERMNELMEKYRDTPMDLADASLVVTAESLSVRQIFTLDSDFRVYRLFDGSVFDIVP